MKRSNEDDYLDIEIVDSPNDSTASYTQQRIKKLNKKTNQQSESSLDKEISSSNKGFKMLQKMGFKKDESYWIEPIEINQKLDKKGIGLSKPPKVVPAWKRKITAAELRAKEFEFDDQKKGFRKSQALNYDSKTLMEDIRKARFACQDLDEKNGKERTEFWPPLIEKIQLDDGQVIEDFEHNEFEQLESMVKLIALNEYLREEYFYCIWCGAPVFENSDEMRSECPGASREAHDE